VDLIDKEDDVALMLDLVNQPLDAALKLAAELVPATRAVRSSSQSSFSASLAGTSPETILWAMPSAIAVLPTPGSPIRQGLFLVRRLRICTTR
jgi:hypothetical protein